MTGAGAPALPLGIRLRAFFDRSAPVACAFTLGMGVLYAALQDQMRLNNEFVGLVVEHDRHQQLARLAGTRALIEACAKIQDRPDMENGCALGLAAFQKAAGDALQAPAAQENQARIEAIMEIGTLRWWVKRRFDEYAARREGREQWDRPDPESGQAREGKS